MIEIIPAIDIIEASKSNSHVASTPPPKYIPAAVDMAKRLSMPVAAVCILWTSMARRAIILSITTHCRQVAQHTTHRGDFGGGLKSDDDLRIAFESGAAMVTRQYRRTVSRHISSLA